MANAIVVPVQKLDDQKIRLAPIWRKAAGLVQETTLDALAEQRQLRGGWRKRWDKQIKLGQPRP
ncbi:hypothetical protein HY523_00250 [Candidatus Berkelbacteria bacterium]|nr:hypothetical protein [Candidatus Berkelbacteria bacterium]